MGKMKKLKKRKRKARKREKKTDVWFSTFKITHEPILEERLERLPEDIQQQYHESFWASSDEPETSASMLEELLEKYPDIPEFKNNLASVYFKMGKSIEAKRLVDENYRMDPDYLFAKTAYAQLCILRKRYPEIPAIFDNLFDLQLLYPDRNVFHITEVMSFYYSMGSYFHAIGKTEQAKVLYKLLLKYGPEYETTKHLGEVIRKAGEGPVKGR